MGPIIGVRKFCFGNLGIVGHVGIRLLTSDCVNDLLNLPSNLSEFDTCAVFNFQFVKVEVLRAESLYASELLLKIEKEYFC